MFRILAEVAANATTEDKQSGEELLSKAMEWVANDGYLFFQKLVVALAIFWIGKKIARWLAGLGEKALNKALKDDMLSRFLGKLVYTALLVLVVISALGELGVDTTSFAAIVAASGLAVGLALKDSLSNFASGVMILIFKPFRVGDVVSVAGETAKVTEIMLFHSILTSPDNQKIIMPNSVVGGSVITNITANENRRVDIVIGCGYDDDIKAVRSAVIAAVSAHDKVLADPGVDAIITDFGADSINFKVMAWVKTPDWGPTRHDLHEIIKETFDKNGFNFPYPQRDVHLHQAG